MALKILVTICVRGGSKGVPGKNIRNLCGKPLIAYSIEQALQWGRAESVTVSTDSDEIADVAAQAGADVYFQRPLELAQDDTPKMPAIRHALTEAERHFNQTFDVLVDLDATSPLRRPDDLERCWQKFSGSAASSLFSVVKAHKNPYFNMVEEDAEGHIRLCKQLPNGVYRRQDAPKVYDMNASIYFYRRDFLMHPDTKMPYDGSSMIYEMDALSAFDIDREIDFKIVELIVQNGFF